MPRSSELEAAVARIQARFGPRALTHGRAPSALPGPGVPHIPTGYPELDALLEIGGLPKGTVCEIVGRPTSGKTTLALRFLAQAQAHGPVAYLDPARVFDAGYASCPQPAGCGLDLSRLLVGRPNDLAECLGTAEALARSETLSALVIDALASGAFGLDAGTSRLVGAFLNRVTSRRDAPLARSGLILLVLHDAEPGEARGTPLAHHAALRLGLRREKWLRAHGDVRGCRARVEVLKRRGPAAAGRASGRCVSIEIQWGGAAGAGHGAGCGLPPHEDG